MPLRHGILCRESVCFKNRNVLRNIGVTLKFVMLRWGIMFKKEVLEKLDAAKKRYDEEVASILDRVPEAKKEHVTISGQKVNPVYTPSDLESEDCLNNDFFPGEYPFTRGIFPAGYLSRGLHIRQVTGIGTAEETNKRWKFLISKGANALSVVGLRGWGPDADDERAEGLVGKDEVVCDTLYDYETLFKDIDLRRYPVHMITASPFALANYIIIAEKQGIKPQDLRGSMSNMLRPEKECLDIIEYCSKNIPLFNAGYLDMRNVREGGCTASQEIAFGVALAIDACNALIKRGLSIDDFAHRITWFVNSGPEFFEEVAKFRAMRRVWAKTFKDRFNVSNPASLLCRMHCQTYAPTLTKAQPFNNIIRSSIYALAAIMGGVQSLHVNSFDEVLSIPTEFSASLSVRTQQIIDLETGITSTIDPLGGSYYVEVLTNQLEDDAWKIIDDIQNKGGAFKAWDWMCNEIRRASMKWQKEFDSNERLLVGVNAFVDEDDIQSRALDVLQEYSDFEALYEYDPLIRDKQIKRLNKVRRERDNEKLEKAKKCLYEAFENDENIMPSLIEAVKCYMSQGEYGRICMEAMKGKVSCALGWKVLA